MTYYAHSFDDEGVTVTFDAIDFLRSLRSQFSADPPFPGTPSPRQAYDAAVDGLKGLLDEAGVPTQGKIGPLSLPPLSPPDDGAQMPSLSPQEILDQIVRGINAAEGTLNAQNFVISSGTVEAQIKLPVAGVNVTFNIIPKPYS